MQYVNASPQQVSSQARTGQNIGGALSNFFQNYLAQQALGGLENDPEFQKMPVSARATKLQQALMPLGQYGQQLLQQRLPLEQLKAQEQQQQQERAAAGQLWQSLYPEKPMPQGIGVKDIINLAKVTNKAPPGGLSGQPVPQEVSNAISQILEANKEASPDQLESAFQRAGIIKPYYSGYVENRRQSSKPVFEPTEDKLEAERVSKFAEELFKDYQVAQSEDQRLARQEELAEKGNLSTPLMVKLLDTMQIPLSILGNPDTEEYRKLETDYVRDISKIFPGVIKNFEIQQYLKTIPGLLNSPEGKKAIIRNRRLLNEAKRIKYDEYKKILKENNGRKPRNLDIEIEERTAGKIDDIAEKFRQGIDEALDKYGPKMKMYDNQGKAYDIPSHLIPQAQAQGLIFK